VADLCPCGCRRPPRPGKMFAGPHLACMGRWRKRTGLARAFAQRERPLSRLRRRAQSDAAASAEAAAAGVAVPLTAAECALWRAARVRGYDNAGKLATLRARHAARRAVTPSATDALAASRRHGHLGGTADSTRKHAEALKAAAARHGLPLTRRTLALWAGAYRLGYTRRYGPAFVRAFTRLTTRCGLSRTAVRHALQEASDHVDHVTARP